VNRYDFSSIVLVAITTITSALVIQSANYNVLGELPSGSTWEPISSVTTDLTGASIMSTNSNSIQTGNTTMNIPSNDTILNSNITDESTSLNSNITKELGSLNSNIANDSSSLNSNIANDSSSLNSNITNKSSLNTTIPNQLPPESINGSRIPKI
jgi:hypothetical protein